MASALSRASRAAGLGVRAVGLDDLLADGHHRVERVFRVLHHHVMRPPRKLAQRALRGGEQVDAVEGEALRRRPRRAAASARGWRGRSATCRSRIRRRCRAARGRARRRRRAPPRRCRVRRWKRTRRSSTVEERRCAHLRGLRIEHVAQAVAEQVEAEADDEDGDARHGGDPPLVDQVVAAGRRSWRPIRAAAAARRGRGSRGRRR